MSNTAAEIQEGSAGPGTGEPASIVLAGVDKRFGATHALDAIDLEVEGGTVHALIGENGAGKSTALGCIAGRVAFDAGSIAVGGTPIEPGDLRAARRAGVAAIYQELTIVPGLNAEANVFLADPLSRGGFLSNREMRARYESLCDEIGVERVSAGVLAGSLSVAEQQLLEIMRSLVVQPRVILFDEPSAPLAIPEREALYAVIDTLKQRGITIIFVSHNLAEVQQLSDRITVFRDGRKVITAARGELDRPALVRHMLGEHSSTSKALAEVLEDSEQAAGATAAGAPARRRPEGGGPPLLLARNVTVPGTIEGIDVEVRSGDILGIAGLVGSGRTTVLRSIAGAEPASTGELWIEGERVKWPRTVRAARRLGIALLPEDRKRQGLVMTMSASDNVALSNLGTGLRHGLLARPKLMGAAAEATERLNFPVARLGERADRFSGGNQQKLLMGRWLHERPRILLADEPTRGIDVGAKSELLEALRRIASEGVGIVVVSSELEEVIAVADRILVLAAGRASGFFDGRSEEISMSTILHAAFETAEGQ
jgi:ABC-type sugar transport system ATPase subunit